VAADEAITIAIEDTLFHRQGRRCTATFFHDGSQVGKTKIAYKNNWLILAIAVHLEFLDRPIALPVGFALVRKRGGYRRSLPRWPSSNLTARSQCSSCPLWPKRWRHLPIVSQHQRDCSQPRDSYQHLFSGRQSASYWRALF